MRAQLTFPSLKARSDTRHGGGLWAGKRKSARIVDVKRSMHVILKSSLATGEQSLLHPRRAKAVLGIVLKHGNSTGVRIERYVNVGTHLHLLVRPRTRAGFQRFLRVVTGRIAVTVTGAVKGRPQRALRSSGGRVFWDSLAFSRAVSWGRDLRGMQRYLDKNAVESLDVCFTLWGLYLESAAWGPGP